MSPNLAPVIFEMQNETAIIGETPRSALVLRVSPRASMHSPDKYTNARVIVFFVNTNITPLRGLAAIASAEPHRLSPVFFFYHFS